MYRVYTVQYMYNMYTICTERTVYVPYVHYVLFVPIIEHDLHVGLASFPASHHSLASCLEVMNHIFHTEHDNPLPAFASHRKAGKPQLSRAAMAVMLKTLNRIFRQKKISICSMHTPSVSLSLCLSLSLSLSLMQEKV